MKFRSGTRGTLALALFLAASIGGCGDSEENLQPLDAYQRSRFQSTLSELSNLTSAVSSLPGPRAAALTSSSSALRSHLAAAAVAGHCMVSHPVPFSLAEIQGGIMPTFGETRLVIEGVHCPLSLAFTFSIKSREEADFEIDYRLVDPALLAVTDITAASAQGRIRLLFDPGQIEYTLTLDGDLTSQNFGQISLYARSKTASQIEPLGTFASLFQFGVRYQDFTAEFAVDSDSTGRRTFLLNREPVSYTEAARYFSALPAFSTPTVKSPVGESGAETLPPAAPPPVIARAKPEAIPAPIASSPGIASLRSQ